jgi:iron complex transport system substrate-binding protein
VSEPQSRQNKVTSSPDLSAGKYARERVVTAEDIIARQSDIVISSWCGKKFRPEKLAARPGFEQISAVRNGALYEMKSPITLQPGPAALTDGLKACQGMIERAGQAITTTWLRA